MCRFKSLRLISLSSTRRTLKVFGLRSVGEDGVTRVSMLSSLDRATGGGVAVLLILSSVGGTVGRCTLDDLRLLSLGRNEGLLKMERTPWADGLDAFRVVGFMDSLLLSTFSVVDAIGCLQRTWCNIFVTL